MAKRNVNNGNCENTDIHFLYFGLLIKFITTEI